ncbi:MAG: transposase [Pirellulaceae bacterium]
MARPLRIEFPGAIYHVMARGNGRQDIVLDDTDCRRLMDGMERAVDRYAWEVFCLVLMTNHFHALVRIPEPNLSRGMQQWLSGYANWWCKRHRHAGHVFQGRFKADLVEDDSYFWTVSRYIHLNPLRAGLVAHPADWPWSSYLGYADRRRRLPWISYESVWDAWQGEFGGPDPVRAYRRYVEQGIREPPTSPFEKARYGWILGSAPFADRLRRMLLDQDEAQDVPLARLLRGLDVSLVFQVVASHYGVDEAALRQRSRHTEPRSLAAWLAKRHTSATLSELAGALGLGCPQSVGNLTRRVELALPTSRKLGRTIKQLEQQLVRHHEELPDDPGRHKKKKK